MAQGSKASYSSKQKRQAKHIEDSERKQGRASKSAKSIAWATVNKKTGGGVKKASSSARSGATKPRKVDASHSSHA